MHFRDGYPTDQHPLPTELLSNKAPEQKNEFKGVKNGLESNDDTIETDEEIDVRLDENLHFNECIVSIKKICINNNINKHNNKMNTIFTSGSVIMGSWESVNC